MAGDDFKNLRGVRDSTRQRAERVGGVSLHHSAEAAHAPIGRTKSDNAVQGGWTAYRSAGVFAK